MKKQSIDHVAKLLAGTSVVVVSSLLTVASASAATLHATALHERTAEVVCRGGFPQGTLCRVASATALHERTEQVVLPNNFGQGTLCRVTSRRD